MNAVSEVAWLARWGLVLMFILGSGAYLLLFPGGFLVIWPFWHLRALCQGLSSRKGGPWRVEMFDSSIEVCSDQKQHTVPMTAIAHVRVASNSNWTESKMLEDAITLFDESGRQLAKVPLSAEGSAGLVTDLRRRGVPIAEVYVSAPVLFD